MISMRPRAFKHDIGYACSASVLGAGTHAEAGRASSTLHSAIPRYRVWAVCDFENHASAR